MKLVGLLLAAVIPLAVGVDVPFSLLVSQEAVTNFNIRMEYNDSSDGTFRPYNPCTENGDDCTALSSDDDVFIQMTLDFPEQDNIKTAETIGNLRLGNATKFEIEYCFETPFTKNRKWRKAKDVIQDDKRCPKKVVTKTNITFGQSKSFNYRIKSDMPDARFFLTLYVFCDDLGTEKKPRDTEKDPRDEFCGIDTTGPLDALAKEKDVRKRLDGDDIDAQLRDRMNQETSQPLSFRTTTIDSRPTVLVVMVVVMSCVSVSMLVLYFVYERVLKKES